MIKDVKRPDKVKNYKYIEPETVGEQSLLSCFFIIIGLFLKIKIVIWIGIFIFAAALATVQSTQDMKQVILNLSLVAMSLFTTYFTQNSERYK